jgi:hypothetical protein
MSQNPSPSRPPDPTNEGTGRVPSAIGGDSSSQVWKFIALALALVLLGVLVFSWYPGPTPEQAQGPQTEEQATEDEEAQEEEAAPQEKPAPAPAPAPPPVADDPRPSPRSSSRGDEPQAGPPSFLANIHVLSVGYSPLPARRVVALRIGGGLPYFLREGDTIGDMKIVAILTDRVQVTQGGKTYDILVSQ